MSGSNRRDFLVTASGLALSPALAAGLFAQDEPKAEAKPEPVRLAIMGVNGRGRQLMNVLAKFPEADCNRDGVIDGSDLAIVLGSWGVCP